MDYNKIVSTLYTKVASMDNSEYSNLSVHLTAASASRSSKMMDMFLKVLDNRYYVVRCINLCNKLRKRGLLSADGANTSLWINQFKMYTGEQHLTMYM